MQTILSYFFHFHSFFFFFINSVGERRGEILPVRLVLYNLISTDNANVLYVCMYVCMHMPTDTRGQFDFSRPWKVSH
jgi:hypothetical protein